MPQTESRQTILKEVHRLAFEFLRDSDVSVYLFGSWERGEECRSSDIDIGVMYEASLPPGILAKLRLAFEESTIPYRVEIVDLTKADPEFRNKVLREGVQWKG